MSCISLSRHSTTQHKCSRSESLTCLNQNKSISRGKQLECKKSRCRCAEIIMPKIKHSLVRCTQDDLMGRCLSSLCSSCPPFISIPAGGPAQRPETCCRSMIIAHTPSQSWDRRGSSGPHVIHNGYFSLCPDSTYSTSSTSVLITIFLIHFCSGVSVFLEKLAVQHRA